MWPIKPVQWSFSVPWLNCSAWNFITNLLTYHTLAWYKHIWYSKLGQNSFITPPFVSYRPSGLLSKNNAEDFRRRRLHKQSVCIKIKGLGTLTPNHPGPSIELCSLCFTLNQWENLVYLTLSMATFLGADSVQAATSLAAVFTTLRLTAKLVLCWYLLRWNRQARLPWPQIIWQTTTCWFSAFSSAHWVT